MRNFLLTAISRALKSLFELNSPCVALWQCLRDLLKLVEVRLKRGQVALKERGIALNDSMEGLHHSNGKADKQFAGDSAVRLVLSGTGTICPGG